MEALAYTHSSIAHEQLDLNPDAYELKLFEGFNWKRIPSSAWLRLVSVAVLLSSLSIIAPAMAIYVNSPNGRCVFIRNGPGSQYSIYSCVADGSPLLPVVGRSGNWVQLSSGRWVYGPYTSDRGSSGGGGGARTAVVVTNGGSLNVRTGPSTGYPVAYSLSNGTRVNLSGRYSGGWAQLSNGYWINSSYTSIGSGGGGGSPNYRAIQVATNGSVLNVRSGPGLYYPVISYLPNRTTAPTSGATSGGWIQLAGGGWVSSSWVSYSTYAGQYQRSSFSTAQSNSSGYLGITGEDLGGR